MRDLEVACGVLPFFCLESKLEDAENEEGKTMTDMEPCGDRDRRLRDSA